jgi:ribonuclease-3
MSKDQLRFIEKCQQVIGYRFKNPRLLREALTHTSGAETPLGSNERMEFLGDSLLGFIVCERLFRQFPQSREGDMTKIKSSVVSRATCLRLGREIGLSEFLIVGRGVGSQTRIPPSMLSNCIESLIAAIFLDGGMVPAQKFVERLFLSEIERCSESLEPDNYKSLLQQVSQREFGITPEYRILTIEGPDHHKCFQISVRIGITVFQSAWGNCKKEAEQRAAENALAVLHECPVPYL